jgi:hypothetical protein
MKDLPAVRWLLRVLVNPGWAPLAVVGLHVALAEYGLTRRFDHLLHFLGGAAIAYFFCRVLLLPSHRFRFPNWMPYLLAFTCACTVALFWEFFEFASDQFLGTTVQQGLLETMLDLCFGVIGAAISLLIVALVRLLIPAVAAKDEKEPKVRTAHYHRL